MLTILKNLFLARQSRGTGLFGLGRRAPARGLTAGRGGMALGTLAAIAAPFVLRKIQARRAQRMPA